MSTRAFLGLNGFPTVALKPRASLNLNYILKLGKATGPKVPVLTTAFFFGNNRDNGHRAV
jgi:hypothetical protein